MTGVRERLDVTDRRHDTASDHQALSRALHPAVAGHLRLLLPLDRRSRAELLTLIEDYAGGRVPLVAPITPFARHIRRCGVPYLADQVCLQPHPVELMLPNPV